MCITHRSRYGIVGMLCILLTGPGMTQPDAPKLGLVLSGGGAKGMAHIGILKALEEAGMYPDVITGTSMGSIIGGLYALGYQADEIDSIARYADWGALLGNAVPYANIAIEEKPYYGRFIAELPVRDFKVGLPLGLIEGQNLHYLLSALTRSAHGIASFDDLPIPYRCVATDIATGAKVDLGEGSLPEAMRASMAIPSVFAPVEINNKLLVDGGLVRNFPVQEALDMGADYIIGVFVSSDLQDKDELKGLTGILTQSSFVMSAYDTREQARLVDLYIAPDLTGYSTGSFKDGPAIIQRGIEKGQELKDRLIALRDSFEHMGKVFKKPVPLPSQDTYQIAEIEVHGNNQISAGYVLGKMDLAPPCTVTLAELEHKIKFTYGTGYFEKITFELQPGAQGYLLKLNIQEKPSNVYVKGAIHYNNEIRAGINLNATLRNILGRNSRAIAEIDFSENFQVHTNYLRYLGANRSAAITVEWSYLNYEQPLYSGGFRIADFKNNRNQLGLNIQTTNSDRLTIGIAADYVHSMLKPKSSEFTVLIDHVRQSTFTTSVFAEYNTLNKPYFPGRGARWTFRAGYSPYNQSTIRFGEVDTIPIDDSVFKVEKFFNLETCLDLYTPIAQHLTLFTRLQFKYLSDPEAGLNHTLGLGGFYENYVFTTPFWGANYYEYQVTDLGLVQAGLRYDITSHLFAQVLLNYANDKIQELWSDDPVETNFGDHDYLLGGGIGIGYRSIVGPILINAGKSNATNGLQAGINIGFWF